MFDISDIANNIISQLVFVVMVVMVIRAIVAYLREDWMQFFSGLLMGILCLIVVLFGPQIEELASSFGEQIFG